MTARSKVAVVLAAGKGTRMRSSQPKVLHRVAGRRLLEWVLDSARAAGCERILVVVGHGAEQIREEVGDGDLIWVTQAEQRGTGHALAQVEPFLEEEATLLVLSGDVPLVTPGTLQQLTRLASAGWGAMAVAELVEPGSLGRVLTDSKGALDRIVEASDAAAEELAAKLVNAGIYALPAPEIFGFLSRLESSNSQGEVYLTEALSLAATDGCEVALFRLPDPAEALGVNDRRDLSLAHRALLDRKAAQLAERV